MRRTLPALLLACALVACGDAPVPPPAAPPPPPPAPGTLEALRADWTPPADVAEQVARWDSPAAVWPALEDLERADRAQLIRAALRLPDGPVTRTAAQHADQRYLDRSERLRATRLICDGLALGEEIGPGNLIETASAADLRAEILPRLRGTSLTQLDDKELDVLHKFMRADDLPAICEWSLASGPPISTGLEFVIEGTAWHTTKHREDVARVILRSRDVPPDDGSGLPESLVAVLRLAFPAAGENVVDIGRYDGWALQWLADEVPAAQDAELLSRIADDTGNPIVLWSLRHVASETRVRTVLAHHDEPAAYAALATAGDHGALARLRDAARENREALAFLLLVEPTTARAVLLEELVDDDTGPDGVLDAEDPGFDAVLDVQDILEDVRFTLCLDLPAALLDPLAAPLLASDIAPDVLLALAPVLRSLWSEECADAILARLDPVSAPESWDEYPDELGLALLELTRRDQLVDRLRSWARNGDERTRGIAVPVLALLGDNASGDVIAAWFERADDPSPRSLQNVDHPAVRALLRRLVEENGDPALEALRAIAVQDGLPPYVELPSGGIEEEPDALGRVRGLVLAGRPIDAFALQCMLDPAWVHGRAGDISDPRVTAYLRERVNRREQDDYLYAMQELAAQGDPEAREIVLSVVRRGDYRWTEDFHIRPWMLEDGMAGLQPWADLAESNCCLVPNGEGPVFRLVGAPLGHWPEPGWSQRGNGDPPAIRMRTWFAEWGPDLLQSDLLSDEDGPQYAPRPRKRN